MEQLNASRPLVVDLDGTLIRTDTLHEMIVRLIRLKPWYLALLPFWFLKGRPFVKSHVYDLVGIDPATLPYNEEFLEFLRAQKKRGRHLILATGSNEKIANAIAQHVGLFDQVIASTRQVNMTGSNKRDTLLLEHPLYDYAGDSRIDGHVWERAEWAVVVHPKSRVLWTAHRKAARGISHVFGRKITRLSAFVKLLNPIDWLPATTLFVYVLLDQMSLVDGFVLWAVWSLMLSSAWIMGELIQLERSRKNNRVSIVADGHLHLTTPLIAVPILFLVGQALSLMQGYATAWSLSLMWGVMVVFYVFVPLNKTLLRILLIGALTVYGI